MPGMATCGFYAFPRLQAIATDGEILAHAFLLPHDRSYDRLKIQAGLLSC